ncbi:hypothetical protein ABGB17_36865 [Sphaerisporangium sp. B11E5]|uniref:hypothetical protein n=1 Tax=Sphaerisporangium sp. B11E5 TaxID=3153563 RepID=UPI00325F44A1
MPAPNPHRTVTVARYVALTLTAVMIWYFLTSDAVRAGNPFLVPDLLLTAFLLISAVLPHRLAAPALLFAFPWAAAVWTVSLFTYITRDAFWDGADHLALILPSLALTYLLSPRSPGNRLSESAGTAA